MYGVVEDAYQHLFNDHAQGKQNNQAIIITGESGAGKSFTTGVRLSQLLKMPERCLQANAWITSIH